MSVPLAQPRTTNNFDEHGRLGIFKLDMSGRPHGQTTARSDIHTKDAVMSSVVEAVKSRVTNRFSCNRTSPQSQRTLLMMMLHGFLSISALLTLLTGASAQPLASSASSLDKRADDIPLTDATLPIVNVSKIGLDNIDLTCDRIAYGFHIVIDADVNLLQNVSYRLLVGQARYGPQGAFLDGSQIFIDHSYLPSQNVVYNQYAPNDPSVNFSAIGFDMYDRTDRKAVLSSPWALSNENNSKGTVVPGEFTAVAFVNRPEFIPNGTANPTPEPIWTTFRPAYNTSYNCTRALTETKSLSIATSQDGVHPNGDEGNGASTGNTAYGLGASLALAAVGTMLL